VRLLVKSLPALLAAAALALAAPMTAEAAARTSATTVPTGNDVSWPQCVNDGPNQGPLPKGQAFAIVGLNDGLANTTNPCFGSEWGWAQGSTGATHQPKASLYVNTANPGKQSTTWPTSNSAAPGMTVNPYGTCTGGEDAACAYVYGWIKAYDDLHGRGAPTGPQHWWLDVETGNTWSSTNLAANRADLEAMTKVFKDADAASTVGIYSTRYQFGVIVGSTVPAGSNLVGLPSWLPGASSAKGAQSNCGAQALTTGSKVTLTQYTSGGFDYDVSCTG
jgi:hypothetical protein